MSVEGAIIAGALQGVTVEVRTAIAPPFTVELGATGAPSPVARLAQPTIILRREGVELFRTSPAGEADPDQWKVTVGLTVAVVVGVLILSLMLSRK